MSTTRNGLLIVGVAAFAVTGFFWTNHREANSPCSDLFYMELVHEEMREQMLADSGYLLALEEGATSDLVAAEDQQIYAAAAADLRRAIEETDIVGLMKHPNDSERKNCYLSLAFSDVLADYDLGQPSLFGVPLDRSFDMVARFEIRFEDVDGVTLYDRIERGRPQYLVEPIEAGELVETRQTARLTRRDFTLSEPAFPQINYATSVLAETDVEAGFFGN